LIGRGNPAPGTTLQMARIAEQIVIACSEGAKSAMAAAEQSNRRS
jgi:hypothetical protein